MPSSPPSRPKITPAPTGHLPHRRESQMTISPSKVDIGALRLAINSLRRAELDYLDPRMRKSIQDSAKAFLFGFRGSPLPCVCRVLKINLTAAKLLLLQWKAQGKIGDPLFSYLLNPDNLTKAEHGIPITPPGFESLDYAGTGTRRLKESGRST